MQKDMRENGIGPSSSSSIISNGYSNSPQTATTAESGVLSCSMDALSDVPNTMEEEERVEFFDSLVFYNYVNCALQFYRTILLH